MDRREGGQTTARQHLDPSASQAFEPLQDDPPSGLYHVRLVVHDTVSSKFSEK